MRDFRVWKEAGIGGREGWSGGGIVVVVVAGAWRLVGE